MTLTPGTRLGPYEIVAPLGAGGMGEVWRARDPRLGRDVAIKALPEAFAADPERLARFEREAKLLASLSHPNVAGIHGLEEVEGHRYLVLEFVEGETLAARLERGALPIGEAAEVCRQIAAGVEAAHEAGVVHRDLKPGNVMLKPDGTVKVLDFGLAKGGAGEGAMSSDPKLSASPTMTYAATQAGVILGTAAYMSPEQARGRSVDRRTDIWSFGCVLYECLTGRAAFEGETVSDLVARILEREPDWSRLPAHLPESLRRLLLRCLTKDARERLRDIGEARIALGEADGPDAAAPPARALRRGATASRWFQLAVAIVSAVLGVVATRFATRALDGAPAPVRRLDLLANDIEMDWFFTPQLSPDGRRIAYIAKNRLWVRDLDQLEPRALGDVDGLTPLAWSPDSRAFAYNDRKKLWKVPVDGGGPTLMCEVPGTGSVIGAAWSRTGTVAFSVWRGGMYQVPEAGGATTLLFDIDPAQMVDFHAPSWLPNGDLLHVVHWKDATDSLGERRTSLAVFDGHRRIPIAGQFGGGNGAPIVTRTGKLLFVRRDANPGIWSVRYDVARRRADGEPRLVAPGAASLSVASDGSLLYMEGALRDGPHEMVWVDRTGRVLESVGAAHPGLTDAVLSPDARRVAFTTTQSGNEDVWVRDLARVIDTRITFAEAREIHPRWIGSSRLSYVEIQSMRSRILAVNADGSGRLAELAPALGIGGQDALIAPGATRAIRLVDDGGHRRLRSAPVLADGRLGPATPLLRLQPEPDIDDAALSADGRLLAYATDDPGQPDVFLTRLPGGEGQWQVSTEGGRRPRWAQGSGELFYIGGSGPSRRALVAVSIDPAQDPPVGTATRLFDIDPRWLRFGEMPYDVSPDGRRFLMTREATGSETRPQRMVLVQNWEAGLTRQGGRAR